MDINKNYNIVLIGFMGCGKTTIGKELSKTLNMHFIDTDNLIEKTQGSTIEDIFDKFGEKYFRKLESETCISVSNLKNTIISTGGGIVKSKNNIYNLKKNGIILYLKATPERIYENIKYLDNRPLLKNKNKFDTINALLKEREYLYEKYSDITINIENKSPFNLVKDIKNILDKSIKSR